MRIVNFDKAGTPTLGVRRGDELIDLSIAAPDLPGDLTGLLEAGAAALDTARKAADGAGADAVVSGEITYLPPIPNPGKILCIGLNYRDHAAEASMNVPDHPVVFCRYANSLVAHNAPMIRPFVSDNYDYEGEMVVVIGRKARHVSKDQALDYVAGYSIFNEGSIRDFQMRTSQWTMGKNFDGTGGFGPDFVTADELPLGATGLKLETRLNGQVLQQASTSDMIFDVATLVSDISQAMTLNPGDIIVSGTPSGVGFARTPPIFMKDGDVCEIEIEGLGVLSNPIRDEKR